MFGALHMALQLQPKAWASQILDAVRDGEAVPAAVVDHALTISGDLKTINQFESPDHDDTPDPDGVAPLA